MGWARARRVDESLRQRSSGSNNHKTPAGAAAAPQAKRTLPSNHASFTLTAHAARTRHRSSSTCPLPTFARPVPQFRFRRQPFASTAKKQQQHHRKKREFLSFIRRFPRNPHSPPSCCTSLFIYVHIFLSCRRRKDSFFCVKLTQQLANWTHCSGQLERQRKH